jgi:NADH-quinone oxidoreductase subunit G
MEEAAELAHLLKEEPEKLPLITTCCPSWVDFMEKFHPDLIEHFSSCKSPQAIVGTLTKTYFAEKTGLPPEKIFMVSIMPCTSKKFEITRAEGMFASGLQDINVSITTRELIRMIQQGGIVFSELDCLATPDSPLGEHSGAGLIFGTSGGVMEAALRSASYFVSGEDSENLEFKEIRGLEGVKEMEVAIAGKTIKVAVAHGLGNVEKVLNKVKNAMENNEEPPYQFIEVMACPGGCVGGGGQAWHVDDEKRAKRAAGLFKEDSLKSVRLSHKNPYVKELYDNFLGAPLSEKAHQLLHTHYESKKEYQR